MPPLNKAAPTAVTFDPAYDALVVRAYIRGGGFDIGKRITRNVCDPETGQFDRKAMLDFTKLAGIHITSTEKYAAAFYWAAEDGKVPFDAASIEDDFDWEAAGLTQDVWMEYYRKACENPPPWNPDGRALEPRKGNSRHVAKGAKLTPEEIADLVAKNPALEAAALEGHKRANQRRAAAKAKARKSKPTADPEPSGIDGVDDFLAGIRVVKSDLAEVLGYAQALPKGDEVRAMITEAADEVEQYVAAIRSVGAGESTDDELFRLLEEGAL